MRRIPVDNPATHLELTMVHEAMVLEYSGRHLAMIDLAASLKLRSTFRDRLRVLPVRHGRQPRRPVAGRGSAASPGCSRLAAGRRALGVAEMSIAKMRVFRVPNFLGAALMLGLLGVLLLFVSRGM